MAAAPLAPPSPEAPPSPPQNIGRQSRSNTVVPVLARASSAARVALRLGSSHSPVPVTQKIRAPTIASWSSSSGG